MGWINWTDMTPTQKLEATKSRPHWHISDFPKFDFWVRKDGHVSQRKGGGSHQLSDASANEILAKYRNPIRSKGDLREWKPGITFHFIKD